MMSDKQTQFSLLRTDYYNSGCLLLLSSCLHGAGIMLGYAIELSCKAALYEAGVKGGSIVYSHDLNDLFSGCLARGYFKSVLVSADFLEYAHDRLHQRYPSQQAEVLKRANQQGRIVHIGVQDLEVYDDLLIQMDDELAACTNDDFVSVGVRNAASADTYAARAFFHCNGPAILRLQRYTDIIKRLRPQNTDAITELEKGEDHLWNFGFMLQYVARNPSADLNTHPAASFTYPKFQTSMS